MCFTINTERYFWFSTLIGCWALLGRFWSSYLCFYGWSGVCLLVWASLRSSDRMVVGGIELQPTQLWAEVSPSFHSLKWLIKTKVIKKNEDLNVHQLDKNYLKMTETIFFSSFCHHIKNEPSITVSCMIWPYCINVVPIVPHMLSSATCTTNVIAWADYRTY